MITLGVAVAVAVTLRAPGPLVFGVALTALELVVGTPVPAPVLGFLLGALTAHAHGAPSDDTLTAGFVGTGMLGLAHAAGPLSGVLLPASAVVAVLVARRQADHPSPPSPWRTWSLSSAQRAAAADALRLHAHPTPTHRRARRRAADALLTALHAFEAEAQTTPMPSRANVDQALATLRRLDTPNLR